LIPRKTYRTYLHFLAGTLTLTAIGTTSCRDHSSPVPISQPLVHPAIQPLDQAAPESEEEKSCHKAVQDFYNAYFDMLESSDKGQQVDAEQAVLRRKMPVLAPQLKQLLDEDRQAQAHSPGDIVGLDFNPYLNAQDWDGRYQVTSATVTSGICKATLSGRDAGKSRDMVIPELRRQDNRWVFVNFHYPDVTTPEDENLIDELQALRKQRDSQKSKGADK
jgi:hypothetical protein